MSQDVEYQVYLDLAEQINALSDTSNKILNDDYVHWKANRPMELGKIGTVLLQQIDHVSMLLGISVLFKAKQLNGYDVDCDDDVQRGVAVLGESYKTHELLRLRDLACDAINS